MRNWPRTLAPFAALMLATACSQGQDTTSPALSSVSLEAVCRPATGKGTIAPAVSIESITFVVNGLDQVLRHGDTLRARPGDQIVVTGATVCAAPFAGNGGEACVDIAPVTQSGQEVVSEHQGSHLVPLTPGLVSIDWVSEAWTVSEDWTQFSAVLNHWPTSGTKDANCAEGRCECDDRINITIGRP